MATHKPIILDDGQLKLLPAGDTLATLKTVSVLGVDYEANPGELVVVSFDSNVTGAQEVELPTAPVAGARIGVFFNAKNIIDPTVADKLSIVSSSSIKIRGLTTSSYLLLFVGDYVEFVFENSAWNCVIFNVQPVRCEVTGDDTTGQSLTHNSTAVADYTIKVSDPLNMADLSSNVLTIPRSGRYMLTWGFGVSTGSPSGTLTRSFTGIEHEPAAGGGFNGQRVSALPSASGITYNFNTSSIELDTGDKIRQTLQVQTDDSSGRTVGTIAVQRSRLILWELL